MSITVFLLSFCVHNPYPNQVECLERVKECIQSQKINGYYKETKDAALICISAETERAALNCRNK